MAQTIIRTPITSKLRNIKQVVQLGEIIGYVSPIQEALIIKAAVSHADISGT